MQTKTKQQQYKTPNYTSKVYVLIVIYRRKNKAKKAENKTILNINKKPQKNVKWIIVTLKN